MKAKTQELAEIFIQIQSASGVVEDVSKGILSAIKSAKATTLIKFNQMVSAAYRENGWSQIAGRPSADSVLTAAPGAVKLYVSIIRSAYRLDLKVLTYDLMESIRVDIRSANKARRDSDKTKDQPSVAPEIVGIQIKQEHSLTGALWHDALVVREHLEESQKALFDAQVRRLLAKYRKEAPAGLLMAA